MSWVLSRRIAVFGFALLVCFVAGRSVRATDGTYHFADRIRLGMRASAYAFDEASGLLYVASAETPRGLFVVDTARPRRADRLGDTSFGSLGLAPDLNELFILSPTEHRIRVMSLASARVAREYEAPVGRMVFYEPSRHDLYVFRFDSANVTILDARTGLRQGEVTLASEPSFVVRDPSTQWIYVRMMNRGGVQAIDPATRAIAATFPVDAYPGGSLAVDAGHRIFTSRGQDIGMLDSRTGQPLATVKVKFPVAKLAYDPTTHLLFASMAAGLAVLRVDAASIIEVQTISTSMPGGALHVNPTTHEVFAAGNEAELPNLTSPTPDPPSSTLVIFKAR